MCSIIHRGFWIRKNRFSVYFTRFIGFVTNRNTTPWSISFVTAYTIVNITLMPLWRLANLARRKRELKWNWFCEERFIFNGWVVKILKKLGPPGSFGTMHIRSRDFRSEVYSFFLRYLQIFPLICHVWNLSLLSLHWRDLLIWLILPKGGYYSHFKQKSWTLSLEENHPTTFHRGETVYISTDEKNMTEIKVTLSLAHSQRSLWGIREDLDLFCVSFFPFWRAW